MKQNQNPNIQKKKLKRKYHVCISLQLIFLCIMLVLFAFFLFISSLLPYLLMSAIFFLLTGAYYNYRYLGRKKMAILYLVGSFLLFLQVLGV